MTGDPFLVALVAELASALSRLNQLTANPSNVRGLLRELGWMAPETISASDYAELRVLGTRGASLASELDELVASESPMRWELCAGLFEELLALIQNIDDLDTTGSEPARSPPFDSGDFWTGLGGDLVDYLLIARVAERVPSLYAVLVLVGIIEREAFTVEDEARQLPYVRNRFAFERVSLLSAPYKLLREVYRWNDPVDLFDHALFLSHLGEILAVVGRVRVLPVGTDFAADYYSQSNPALETARELRLEAVHAVDLQTETFAKIGLRIAPVPSADKPDQYPSGLVVAPYAEGSADLYQVAMGSVDVRVGGDLAVTGPRLEIFPSGVHVKKVEGHKLADSFMTLRADQEPPWTLVGAKNGARLEAGAVEVSLYASGSTAAPEVGVRIVLDRMSVVIDLSAADSFTTEAMSDQQQRIECRMALDISTTRGIRMNGRSGAVLRFPLNRKLRSAELLSLSLGLAASDKDLTMSAAVSARIALGPVRATVDGVGGALTIRPRERGTLPGAFGRVDLRIAFKPPDGVGLAVDAGAVTGGGFLSFDSEKEQYAGVVQLEFEGIVVTGVGLLTTRLPDGSEGFSLVVIVITEGFRPIQLGFGFTLNGVGGLLGVNRTVAVEPLRTRLGDRSLDSVFFPRDDPVGRAPQIVSAIAGVFPPARGRFVFGPMARIGWGTPTLLTIDAALILEFPSPARLIVLGRLHAALPPGERALVVLNMDALGVLEFERREVAVDASLYDSRIVKFPLTGNMAMRASWGESPTFVLAVGGLHPDFEPPAGFPRLRPLALALSSGTNPRLHGQAYLALTSNTVQLGARFDFFVGVSRFSLEGTFGFDTLVRVAPLRFQADIAACLTLKAGGSTLMALDVRVTLLGPAPWIARGRARYRVLFFSISIPFEAKFGAEAPLAGLERIDVWGRLRAALVEPGNWSGELGAAGGRLAILRPAPVEAGVVLVHPLGDVTFRQRLVPLERELARFGSAEIEGERRFALAAEALEAEPVSDLFAPGEFFELSDAERLAAPSFERMPSGLRLLGGGARGGPDKQVPIRYETHVLADGLAGPGHVETKRYDLPPRTLPFLVALGPAGSRPAPGRTKYTAPRRTPAAGERTYSVTAKTDARRIAEAASAYESWITAREALQQHSATHSDLQVVATTEAAS